MAVGDRRRQRRFVGGPAGVARPAQPEGDAAGRGRRAGRAGGGGPPGIPPEQVPPGCAGGPACEGAARSDQPPGEALRMIRRASQNAVGGDQGEQGVLPHHRRGGMTGDAPEAGGDLLPAAPLDGRPQGLADRRSDQRPAGPVPVGGRRRLVSDGRRSDLVRHGPRRFGAEPHLDVSRGHVSSFLRLLS